MRNEPVIDLLTLLEQENLAIIAGDYPALDLLADRKQALFEALPSLRLSQDDLRAISGSLVRNKSLLAAAIKGIAAARTRLAALRAVREGLQVYDRSGQFATAPLTRPDHVKKA
jgi:flagellar biosynthesis/type III secretory pathway chaperone